VLGKVPVGFWPRGFLYNQQSNKVYSADYWGSVTVISGAADTVLATLPVGGFAGSLCCNTRDNKVYCGSDSLIVIDGVGDTVITKLPGGDGGICFNSRYNKVYGVSGSQTVVIDGRGDTVLTTAAAGSPVCYDSLNNKVYCVSDHDTVSVIDGATDAVVARIGVGLDPIHILWNEVHNRIYVANYRGSSISVLRDSMSGVQEGLPPAVSAKPAPTVVRSVLFLPLASSVEHGTSSTLLDVSGRQVLELTPGPNDVRALAPGVYFVRAVSRELSAVSCSKVVITR
jgi:YVTN family beta-propeller protein